MRMANSSIRKKQLDKQRTEWRKKHRTLNGKIILYPEKPPEHVNARGSKVYNWFWKKILLETNLYDIPAIISALQNNIKSQNNTDKIRMFRTMIGMAEDAYQLKQLEDIKDYDSELMLGPKPVYDADDGVIYIAGKIFTIDFNEHENELILRDVEGVVVDSIREPPASPKDISAQRNNVYKNWNYMEKP